MSLQDSLFSEDVEFDVTVFSRDDRRKRVLVFPPVNNYRRYIIHQLVQDRFPELHTFSIGQASARRTVVCYKTDLIRDPKLNGAECKQSRTTKSTDNPREMGVEGQRSPSVSPERVRSIKSVKPVPKVEIYRPPAARRAKNEQESSQTQSTTDSPVSTRSNRQKRPDRAVYVPRHRRSTEPEGSPQPVEVSRTNRSCRESSTLVSHGSSRASVNAKESDSSCRQEYTERMKKGSNAGDSKEHDVSSEKNQSAFTREPERCPEPEFNSLRAKTAAEPCQRTEPEECSKEIDSAEQNVPTESDDSISTEVKCERTDAAEPVSKPVSECKNNVDSVDPFVNCDVNNTVNQETDRSEECKNDSSTSEEAEEPISSRDEIVNQKNTQIIQSTIVTSEVLIISDSVHNEQKTVKEVSAVPITPPEKKVKKIERPKSKPAPPPSPPVKINRDECDWDSLFDDNGDCLDPSLIEELTSAVGEVMIEQPKSDYKAYTKHVEVSSDEFAHVVEIYNFPSEFKTSDLAAVFSPFKNGGFELKWVDDTHCLGVFSSPLIAAEVLASNHPFVKTRPLSEATALSKTKAKRSAEFLQPYRSRPETCAALARRLVTGALGVKLATARQEREHEKNVLREAKEKRRLANKQREDAWEGIIPEK